MSLRAVLLACALAACGGREAPPVADVAELRAPVPQEAQPPNRAEARDPVGVIMSKRAEVVPAPFAGRIVEVYVKSGEVVKVGEKLARFDTTEIDAQIGELKADETASASTAAASYKLAEWLHTQYKSRAQLAQVGQVSGNAVKQAYAEWQAKLAEASAEAARGTRSRTRRGTLEKQRQKAELVASLDGVVLQLAVKQGEVVAAGTPIARVFNPDNLFVRFAVPADLRASLKRGQRVEFRTDGTKRPVVATIERFTTEPPPINFTVVEAAIDEVNRFDTDAVRVAATGSVRLAAVHGGQP